MAIRTISNMGGNWNATGTWVENAVPIAGDDIIATSTSGNLTVNVATANMRSVDLSNYLATLTLNNTFNIGGPASGFTSSFSPTMSFSTATNFTDTNCLSFSMTGAHAIRTNGRKLPYVGVFKNSGTGTFTMLDDLNVTTLSVGLGNQQMNIGGTYSIYVNHYNRSAAGGGALGGIVLTSTFSSVTFVGPTASYNGNSLAAPVSLFNCNVVIDVGATGTFSTVQPLAVSGVGGSSTIRLWWKSGNLGGTKSILFFDNWSTYANNSQVRLDLAAAGTFSNVYYNDVSVTSTERYVTLLSDLYFDNLESAPNTPSSTARRSMWFFGPGVLRGGRVRAVPVATSYAGNTLGTASIWNPHLRLPAGLTCSFSDLTTFIGYDSNLTLQTSPSRYNGNALVSSATPGTKAGLIYTGVYSATPSIYTSFVDIDASAGNPIYVYGGASFSNSNNITPVTFGGGGGGSYTFVN